uniref:DUF5641 domain-containing protein n=1 Tax=Ascaris lumbricoides TaxID=6252 RepID=A0A0M3ITC7_ASCLU
LKLFLQHLWKKEYDWDQAFDNTDRQTAATLLERFQGQSLKLDRKLTAELDKERAEIHVFVDASKNAYAAVAYLRSYRQNRYESSLLMSKSRVAPIRGITIPRLELMAALIGSRLLNFVQGQLKHTGPTFLWSDSQATLHWIAAATTVDRFVDNRLAEIRRSPAQFRYVDSGNNPADLATRGLTIAELKQCSQWWEGPTFLQQESQHWPEWTAPHNPVALVIIPSTPTVIDIVECERFSCLNKLKRTTVQVLRAIKRMLRSAQIHLERKLWETVEFEGPATAGELEWAELILILQEQTKAGEEFERNTDANLYKDEQGIVRCLGRLEHAALPEETIHPVLLPKSSALTKLVVLARHKEFGHTGVSQTLASLVKQVMQNILAAPITWRFINPFAPWQGGVYERLVGLTKTAFRKAVGRRLLNEEEFKTLVIECEAIVNSRPLTYVDSAIERILRPVDFLRPQAIIAAQEPSPENHKGLPHTADSRGKLLGLWKATISNLDRFWKIWTHDYLMSLRERHCMEHQQPCRVTDRAPLENEIVIVAEEGLPRAEWKLGKVEKLHKDHGGKTKAVDVRMPNGHVLKRP